MITINILNMEGPLVNINIWNDPFMITNPNNEYLLWAIDDIYFSYEYKLIHYFGTKVWIINKKQATGQY